MATGTDNLSLWGLFLSSFLSSTLLPGSSEAIIASLAHYSQYHSITLITVATIANTLGGITTLALGRITRWKWPQKSFSKKHGKAIEQIKRLGSPVLLLSWLPIIGDPLCFAAGWLKLNWVLAILFIAMGKAGRYAAIVYLFST
jgi:membrane protein YqaA with SNARE-associated domain